MFIDKSEFIKLAKEYYALSESWKNSAKDKELSERQRTTYLRYAIECLRKAQELERQAKL